MKKCFRHRVLHLVVALFYSTTSLGLGFDASALPRNQDEGNVREFFASNRQKRFLMKVHVWGDVPQAGVYYVPDNATLLDVLGYAGGPLGLISSSDVTLNRMDAKSKVMESNTFPGADLVMRPELRKDLAREGDVVFVDSPERTDQTGRILQIISVTAGILAAGAAIYSTTRN